MLRSLTQSSLAQRSLPHRSAARTMGRKAVSPWIAWVLLLAFAVALSAFMYSFMVDYTEDTTEGIKKQVYNTDECRQASLSIEDACVDTSAQILNITLQNRNYIRLDKIDFRLYVGRTPISTVETTITLNPNRKKLVSVNTSTTDTVTYVEVIPHIETHDYDIICGDKKVASEVSTC
jgi:FlaG/FlaF family flagellin (archaellin)